MCVYIYMLICAYTYWFHFSGEYYINHPSISYNTIYLKCYRYESLTGHEDKIVCGKIYPILDHLV